MTDDERNISQAILAQLGRQYDQLCIAAHPGEKVRLHYFKRPQRQVPYAIFHCDGPSDFANGLWVSGQYAEHVEVGRLEEALDLFLF